MRRIITIIIAFLAFSCAIMAQTPVESLAESYDGQKGVKVIVADGATMSFARPYIRKSPMGPLANNVEAVTILSLKKASGSAQGEFLARLRGTLKSYQFYGKETGEDGNIVEVYGSPIKNGVVHELVVYNPDNHVLFSLRGSYPVDELQKLDPKKK